MATNLHPCGRKPLSTSVIAKAIVALAAFVQAGVGVGFAMIAVPLLLLLEPTLIPVPLLGAMLFPSLGMLAHECRDVDWVSLAALVPGLAIGTVFAIGLLPLLPERYEALFAIIIVFAVAWSIWGSRVPTNGSIAFSAGVAAGITGTVAGLHGPALALMYQYHAPASARATIAAVFMLAASLSIGALLGAGAADVLTLRTSVQLTPGLLIGFALAAILPVPPPHLARASLPMIAATSAMLLPI